MFRLNSYLIGLLSKNKLVGISLKKINEPDKAELILRNIDEDSYLDSTIETKQYKMSDIDLLLMVSMMKKEKQFQLTLNFQKTIQLILKDLLLNLII